MYLKKLIAHGFKSFADNTVIEFNNNISGIVGPNGSGKSNIVDAIRWVLGEQSIKSLRGDSMTDVIFSGSKSRNGMNIASITLVFDNNDHYLPINFDEVSIKRRLYKDGTNEYFLNGEKVRLKDINNILLDSGIAKESFNIISQGKIEEILSNKPEARRTIFEEAAGVIKYKKRKEEALRKLDRTNNNMDRVNDIIKELESQINPLKEQKEKALEYQEFNEKLKKLEISLAVSDITNINDVYQQDKDKVEKLKEELASISTSSSINEAKTMELKLNITNKDTEIKELNINLLDITEKVEQINSEKNILLERKKYQVDDFKLHNNIVVLKEEQQQVKIDISNALRELDNKNIEKNKILDKININNNKLKEIKKKKEKLIIELNKNILRQNRVKNDIEALKESIDNNSSIPYAVKSILDNPKLRGIHDTVGNIIEVDELYSKAISVALISSTSSIIVDSDAYAKEAINYLKENKLGRVTFLPLNNMKPKDLSDFVKEKLNIKGFINIASKLVNYDIKYKNIINHLLGNIIVVDNIDTANELSKKIKFSNRIVTLDGDVINVGGSITGGNIKIKNVILDKYELEKKVNEEKNILNIIKDIENSINDIDYNLKNIEDELYLNNKNLLVLEDEINIKNTTLDNYNQKLLKINNDLNGTNNIINNNLSKEEDNIITKYYEAVNEKNTILNNLNRTVSEKKELEDSLNNYEFSIKKENSIFTEKNEQLKNLEIEDNKARNQISILKRKINALGSINLGAIEEYDRISERYEFLINQQNDLAEAKNTLIEIINDMDQVMKKEFLDTFNIINSNFEETFRELFKGGKAHLELTDKDNLLETGIEIIASPPGKTLKNIRLLSGGEKTFTAISLLFAILKTRTMPFCVLDEVEAALDEVNVQAFGEYLLKLKEKTQFIVITHKKKTMEYANYLYGITMQESGVSKLVSVKLEEIEEGK